MLSYTWNKKVRKDGQMEKKKTTLNFRFHNPNPTGIMEKALENLLIDSGIEKLHKAVCEENNNEERKRAQ